MHPVSGKLITKVFPCESVFTMCMYICVFIYVYINVYICYYMADVENGRYYNMSSFVETRIEKIVKNKFQAGLFVSYSNRQLSRVYPKGQRMDSSNFDPIPMWNAGSQLVSLNYQTGGKGTMVCVA